MNNNPIIPSGGRGANLRYCIVKIGEQPYPEDQLVTGFVFLEGYEGFWDAVAQGFRIPNDINKVVISFKIDTNANYSNSGFEGYRTLKNGVSYSGEAYYINEARAVFDLSNAVAFGESSIIEVAPDDLFQIFSNGYSEPQSNNLTWFMIREV